MTEDELDAQYYALKTQTDALDVEHRELEQRPHDMAAHREHGQRLRDHIKRLHAHMEARGMRRPDRRRLLNADRQDV